MPKEVDVCGFQIFPKGCRKEIYCNTIYMIWLLSALFTSGNHNKGTRENEFGTGKILGDLYSCVKNNRTWINISGCLEEFLPFARWLLKHCEMMKISSMSVCPPSWIIFYTQDLLGNNANLLISSWSSLCLSHIPA